MRSSAAARRQAVFSKTQGHCHFCGDDLKYELYGRAGGVRPGAWVIDHVIQRKRGGKDDIENFLPICPRCNHLRWHRRGDNLRELLELGLVAKDEVKRRSPLGRALVGKREARREQNLKRRRKGS